MRTSIRALLSGDDGATRWLVGAAGGALLIAGLATLPALADEPVSPTPPASPASPVAGDAVADEAIIGEPLEDDLFGDLVEEATDEPGVGDPGFEGIIGEPLEDDLEGDLEQLDADGDAEGIIGEPLQDEVVDEG